MVVALRREQVVQVVMLVEDLVELAMLVAQVQLAQQDQLVQAQLTVWLEVRVVLV